MSVNLNSATVDLWHTKQKLIEAMLQTAARQRAASSAASCSHPALSGGFRHADAPRRGSFQPGAALQLGNTQSGVRAAAAAPRCLSGKRALGASRKALRVQAMAAADKMTIAITGVCCLRGDGLRSRFLHTRAVWWEGEATQTQQTTKQTNT